MASRWICSSDDHESTPGKRWRCRVRPNCGRFLERPPGRSEAETWHDGSSNRVPSQERPLFKRGRCRRRDCFLPSASRCALRSTRAASWSRCMVLRWTPPCRRRLCPHVPGSNSAKNGESRVASCRPGSIGLSNGSEVHVVRRTSTTAVDSDGLARTRLVMRFTSAAWPSNRRVRTSFVFWKAGESGLAVSRSGCAVLDSASSLTAEQHKLVCVPILNGQSRMLYDWSQCLPPCIRR
jgi:hypothetical protein